MPPKRKPTRGKTSEKYGGIGSDLPTTALPTHGDVARCFDTVKDAKKDSTTQMLIVKDKLESVWQQCNSALPLMEKIALRTKLTRFLDKVREFDRNRMKLSQKKLLLAVKEKLFDISACSCQLPVLPCKSKLVNCNAEDEDTCDKNILFVYVARRSESLWKKENTCWISDQKLERTAAAFSLDVLTPLLLEKSPGDSSVRRATSGCWKRRRSDWKETPSLR
jgi:hypothetical protein